MARPLKKIDPAEVERLAARGYKITQIARRLGANRDTIRDRFSAELRKGEDSLHDRLRQAQINAAEQGNTTMLIWLGKQYLEQSDTTIDEYLLEAIEAEGITKEDLLELIRRKDQLLGTVQKRSFQEFVDRAGYPAPYPKQLEMMKFGIESLEPRLLLGARGYGKTDYITILGTAYDIYLHPGLSTNLIITKSDERNKSILREIKEACEANGVQFEIANATALRTGALEGKDNSVSAVTIGTSSLRGRHPKRVIMDDPVTEDDTSEATRLKARKVLNEVMKLTKNVLLIGQPAHQYDLYADVRGAIGTMEVPYGSIVELDHDLEAQRLAGVSEASISASYFLKVLTEGTSPFGSARFLEPGAWPAQGTSVAFIDPSEGGDYTAITILKQYMQGVAAVGFVWKKAWNHCLDDMVPLFKKYGVAKLAFETNCTGEQPLGMLRELFKGIGVVGRRANSNKHSRIMAAGAYAHLIHLSKESHKTYLDHVVKYEYKAKFDDAPDSLASLLEWIGLIRGKQ